MDLFEAKSDRGLERRVDEADLRNLYRAGHLHLESRVRRAGSPNWFRVEEMFPHFEKMPSSKKYSAKLNAPTKSVELRMVLLVVLSVLVLSVLLIHFSKKISAESRIPVSQIQPGS